MLPGTCGASCAATATRRAAARRCSFTMRIISRLLGRDRGAAAAPRALAPAAATCARAVGSRRRRAKDPSLPRQAELRVGAPPGRERGRRVALNSSTCACSCCGVDGASVSSWGRTRAEGRGMDHS